MDFKVLDPYGPLFHSNKTYFLISGGRASGKSTQAAAYFLIKLMGDEFFRGVVARYTQKSIKSSIYRDILDLAEAWNIKQFLRIDGDEITNVRNDNMILTHSMKLADGTMTARGKGLAKVTHLLIDEATELPDEQEFIKLNDSFRTKGVDRKIFILFNPTSKRHWIHARWYMDGQPNPKWFDDHVFIHTTYKDNIENIDPKKIVEWERMKELDPEYYAHHILGEWTEGVIGRIFTGWELEKAPAGLDVTYGLDFGYASDPAALVKVTTHNGKMWLEQMIYETGLTNEDIHQRMVRLGIPKNAQIIADSAEPKSIEELKRKGWRIQAAYKGPDSIRIGIDKIKQYQVYIHPDSDDLKKEYELYSWKAGTDKPIDMHNHAIDAIRYALSLEKSGQYAFVRGNKNKFIPD